MSRLIEKEQARRMLFDSFREYGYGKVKMKFLTLSKKKDDSRDLLSMFYQLHMMLQFKFPRARIDYFMSYVDGQHIHCIIRLPWLPIDDFKMLWSSITGYGESFNMALKMIKSDMRYPSKIGRLVDYVIEQDKGGSLVKYIKSPDFGIAHKKRVKGVEKVITVKDWLEERRKRRKRAERLDLE